MRYGTVNIMNSRATLRLDLGFYERMVFMVKFVGLTRALI